MAQIGELGGFEDFPNEIFQVTEDQDSEENQQSTVEYMADQSASPGKSSCVTHMLKSHENSSSLDGHVPN